MGKWLNVAQFQTTKRRGRNLPRGLTAGYSRVPASYLLTTKYIYIFFATKNVLVMYVT